MPSRSPPPAGVQHRDPADLRPSDSPSAVRSTGRSGSMDFVRARELRETMRPGRVIIAGAGIGGMALAAALQRLGIPVLVLERAPQLGEVGAGLGILPNAVRALAAIGVSRALYDDAGPFRRFRICSHRGQELTEIDFEGAFRRVGGAGYVMHRAALHAAISECVDPASIRTNTCVTSIEQSEDSVSVRIAGELAPVSGDLLVGADGLKSVVRGYVL